MLVQNYTQQRCGEWSASKAIFALLRAHMNTECAIQDDIPTSTEWLFHLYFSAVCSSASNFDLCWQLVAKHCGLSRTLSRKISAQPREQTRPTFNNDHLMSCSAKWGFFFAKDHTQLPPNNANRRNSRSLCT